MDIRNRSALKQEASASLRSNQNEKQLIAVYTGVTIALSVAVLVLDEVLDHAVSGTGGLSNLGTRSLLQMLQSVFPLFQMLFLLCWDMGYLRSMLNISRERPAQIQTLNTGFGIFGPTLRLNLLLGLIFGAMLFGCMYLGIWIFMLTPFADPLMEVVSATYSGSMLSTEMVLTDEVMNATSQVMLPMMAIVLALFALIALPKIYNYRMVNYCLLDKPQAGALAAMAESKRMMRGNRLALFKLDLSIWWIYLLELLVLGVSYGDVLLPMLGVELPFSSTVSYYLFYGLYFVLAFGLNYSLRNYREVIYAKTYDALRPPETPTNGIVLGNIFQM